MAGAVIAGLTDNPALPALTFDLKTVQTAADELNAALTAQAHGGKAIVIKDLIPGTTYVFQVRAVGGSTGYSDWSNPVSRMCT
jgi:hypothetical protein